MFHVNVLTCIVLKGPREYVYFSSLHDSYMDYQPIHPEFHHLSPWLKTIYSGDYQTFLKMMKAFKKKAGILENMLKVRESLLRINSIFHVVIGARSLAVPVEEPLQAKHQRNARKTLNVKNEHMKILDTLLSLGVDVNVRDLAGFTPLHHCFTKLGNKVTLEMAEKLINAGADVNAKNRFGNTPLQMHIGIYDKPSISTNETSVPVISLLLKHGADPNLINYFNMSTFSILEMGCGPISKDLFMQLHQEWKATPRSNESEKACSNCGKDTKSNKRCTGCYTVWYCSRDCQVKKWKQHGKICKEIQAKVCQKIQEWEPSRKC